MLLVLLLYQASSPFGEMDSKTSLNSSASITESSHEQQEIKAFTNLYTTEFLAETEEEVGKKKSKKKSISTAYQTNDNVFSLLKFVSVQRVVGRFILSSMPLYKLFHSWKIPCFKNFFTVIMN